MSVSLTSRNHHYCIAGQLNTEHDLEITPYARESWVAASTDQGKSFGTAQNLTHLQRRTETWHSVSPGGGAIQLSDGTIVVPGCEMAMRSRLTMLPVSLTLNVSLFQTT